MGGISGGWGDLDYSENKSGKSEYKNNLPAKMKLEKSISEILAMKKGKLYLPKLEKYPIQIQIPETDTDSKLEKVLVFSSGSKIFVLDNNSKPVPIIVASRDDVIRALCSHNGKLYDGGDYSGIFETLTNKKIASRYRWVRALCSHNGKLYDAGYYEKIFETLTNKKIASRNNWILALCSHNGKLYDGGYYGGIFETLTNKKIASINNYVWALCSHPRKYFVDAGVLK
jgi:hypothetical protein